MQDDFCLIDGLCVEPRPYGEFSVHTFIQGLYIPSTEMDLSLGERIGYWKRDDWQIALPAIQQYLEKRPHYDSISTIINMINRHTLIYWGSEIRKYEFLAFSYIVINHYCEAQMLLKRIIDFENDKSRPGWSWMKDIVDSAKNMLHLIKGEKWEEIRAQLLCWQKETMAALKLPEQ